jgi:hypothetical protein
MIISRVEFFRKVIQAGLFALIAILLFTLGNRIVTGNDCSGCPGNGLCHGESDCSRYKKN